MALPTACRALRLFDLPVCKIMVTSLEGLGCYQKTHYCLLQNALIDKSEFLNRFLNFESDGRGVVTADTVQLYPKFYFASVTSSFKPISTITYPSHSASFWVPSMGQRLATIPGLCVPELLGAYPCFSLFWKRQGLPISLAALTSSSLPWSLFLRPPSGASVRLLFFRWACLCSSHLSSTTSGSSWWSLHFPQVWFYSFSLHFLKNACRVLTAKRLEHSKLSVKSPFTSRPGTAHTPGSWLAAGVGGLVGWFSHKVTRLKKALSWTTAVLFIRL